MEAPEKSMNLGYLALLVAEIPRWITYMIEKSEIDFATYPRYQLSTDLLKHYDNCLAGAKTALKNLTFPQLEEIFYLKNNGQVVNNIPVPSIYGPSADEKIL